MEQYFQGDTCVLACSGPSLNNVDVLSLGLPVVVVSTAIRKIPNPDFWAVADNLNSMHGPEGKSAWNNSEIRKVVPQSKIIKGGPSFISVPYSASGKQGEVSKTLFEKGYPLLRGPHKTVTFVIQWLHVNGIKNIIFAGNDLAADNFESKYAYKLESFDMRKKGNFKKTLDQVTKTLKIWHPIARQKGFEWYSWKCGHVFESLVPRFTEEMEKEYMAKKTKKKEIETVEPTTKTRKKTKKKVVEIPEVEILDSQKILEETTKNFVNTVNNNMNVNENEWKEKCKKFMETKSK